MSSLSHLTSGLASYEGGLIQAATRSRYKSSSNSFKFPEDPVFHLPSIILFPQHVLDEPLSSSVRNQGDECRKAPAAQGRNGDGCAAQMYCPGKGRLG